MRYFKSRKPRKKKRILFFLFIFFFVFSYVFMIKYCNKNKLKVNLLNDKNNYVKADFSKEITNKIDEIINTPVFLLNQKVRSVSNYKKKKNAYLVSQNNSKPVNKVDEQNPLIYVYNTHQTENYNGYSVYDATYNLSNKLNQGGVSTYFEEQSVSAFLQSNNLKYYKSYTVSRNYLNEAKTKFQTLKYFFDIHRDALSKNASTYNYNGKNYAKVLFIVGLDNPNYQANLANAEKLNTIIEKKVPGLSRGIMKKGGKGVDGLYNQDVSPNAFLIELGGNNNTKEEVELTIDVIYESILDYVRGAL